MSQRRLFEHPLRVAVVVVGLLAVLNLGVWIALEQDSSEPGERVLPNDIESVQPAPGSTTGLVVDVVADLTDGFTGTLQIGGECIPLDQLDVDPSLGTVGFRPGPDKLLRKLDPGEYAVVVYYRDATSPKPAEDCDASPRGVSSFRWSFRATS